MRRATQFFMRWLQGGIRSRVLQLSLVGVVAVALLGADDSRFQRLGHGMICTCSCGQILLECNHVGCPDSARMIGELRDQLATGGPDTQIFNWFVAKYGPIVLAAPTQSGFGEVAWVTPLAAFVLATLGTGAIVWAWRRRTLRLAGPTTAWPPSNTGPDPETDALRDKIRRETEYR